MPVKTFDLMDIPESKLNTNAKKMYHKNYIARLMSRGDFHLVVIFPELSNIEDVIGWFKQSQNPLTDIAGMRQMIKTQFSGWKWGLKRRLEIAEDFTFITHIIREILMEIEEQGAERLSETLRFFKTINLEELHERLKADVEYKPDVEDEKLDDNDDEVLLETAEDTKRDYHKSFETIDKMCKKRSKKAEITQQTRVEKEAKLEIRLEAEMEKAQLKLDKLRSKQKKSSEKEEKDKIKQEKLKLLEQEKAEKDEKKRLAEEARIAKEEEKKNKLENREMCGCGGYFSLNHKAHHIRTKKHLEWLNTQGGEGEP